MTVFKVGTRDSLLALTQTKVTLAELAAKTGHEFEIVSMKTEGDLNTSKPLWQMDGKNFFTKELDTALLNGDVDFMVSSFKDIGSERPEGIIPACVTKREYSQDILLIKKEKAAKVSTMKKFIVGTSSPRRIFNITKELGKYIPLNETATIECENLRGNVDTRIKKLLNDDYDAIILALAGIERLSKIDKSKEVLKGLLKDLTFMVLPEKAFPSSPSQGSLLLECLESSSDELKECLNSIHDEKTARELKVEKDIFHNYGGGCHLALGVYSKELAGGTLTVQKGNVGGELIDEIDFKTTLPAPQGNKIFIGMPLHFEDENVLSDQMIQKDFDHKNDNLPRHLLLTSSYGLRFLNSNPDILWVSGDHTLFQAVKKGLWVNGSTDSLGEDVLKLLINSEALKIMGVDSKLGVLTSSSAKSTIGDTIPCYTKKIVKPSDEFIAELKNIRVFYWSSFPQFETYADKFPFIKDTGIIHSCGLGKTYLEFEKNNIPVVGFDSIKSLRNWFNKD